MIRLRYGWLIGLAFIATGCVTSDQGLCAPDEHDASFDPSLLGVWVGPGDSSDRRGVCRMERPDPARKTYLVHVFKEQGPQRVPVELSDHPARLIRLGDAEFLDVFLPEVKDVPTGKNRVPPAHLFVRLQRLGPDELRLQVLDKFFFTKQPRAIRHVIEHPRFLPSVRLTAPAPELRAFLREHAHDEAMWGKAEGTLRRR